MKMIFGTKFKFKDFTEKKKTEYVGDSRARDSDTKADSFRTLAIFSPRLTPSPKPLSIKNDFGINFKIKTFTEKKKKTEYVGNSRARDTDSSKADSFRILSINIVLV